MVALNYHIYVRCKSLATTIAALDTRLSSPGISTCQHYSCSLYSHFSFLLYRDSIQNKCHKKCRDRFQTSALAMNPALAFARCMSSRSWLPPEMNNLNKMGTCNCGEVVAFLCSERCRNTIYRSYLHTQCS
jgi:hypothetical protein